MINIIYMFQFFFNFGKTNCTGMLPVLIEPYLASALSHPFINNKNYIQKMMKQCTGEILSNASNGTFYVNSYKYTWW